MTNIKTVQRNGKGSLTALAANPSMLDIPVMTQIAQADSMYSENLVRSGNGYAYSEQMENVARSGNGYAFAEDPNMDLARSGNGYAFLEVQAQEIARSGNGYA